MISLKLSYASAVVLRIVTLAMAALGVVIQRKSHIKNDNKILSERKSALKRPLWHVGFWIYVLSSVVSDIIGISSLPLLVIALVGTLILFFNAIYSHYILDENMRKKGWFATFLVAVSSAGLAILLNLPNTPKTVPELERLVVTPVYLIYSALNVVSLVTLLFATLYCLKKREREMNRMNENMIENMNENKKLDRYNFWIALLYQSSSTILAALAMVFAKITFELFQHSMTTGNNEFKSPISICFLIITIITTILQLVLFNYSLHYYTTLFTIPFGYAFGIILACFNTLVYYDSFFVLEAWMTVMVVMCVIVTIIGIYLLTL
jgi:magnesium transporter